MKKGKNSFRLESHIWDSYFTSYIKTSFDHKKSQLSEKRSCSHGILSSLPHTFGIRWYREKSHASGTRKRMRARSFAVRHSATRNKEELALSDENFAKEPLVNCGLRKCSQGNCGETPYFIPPSPVPVSTRFLDFSPTPPPSPCRWV